MDKTLLRIGVFYDGNFFFHVSNYYLYHHPQRSRISISGLHEFIRHEVAGREGREPNRCQIVDAHYFRGRLRADEAQERDMLYKERQFDDVLLREGITTHYAPLSPQGEKGIDVWYALEAFELAIYKHFDVVVLIACDGDYVPLARKLNTLGTRVMILGWDFSYMDQNGNERETRTAQALLNEVTHPLAMAPTIDERMTQEDPMVLNLFMPRREFSSPTSPASPDVPATDDASDTALPAPPVHDGTGVQGGEIQNLKSGYGFITPDEGGDNLFFYHASVIELDFNDLRRGDRVHYVLSRNEQGPCADKVRLSDPRSLD